MTIVAYEAIEIFPLPNRAAAAAVAIDGLGSPGFPGVNNVRKSIAGGRRDQHMHVVGHDDPGEQLISEPRAVVQRALNDLRHRRLAQKT